MASKDSRIKDDFGYKLDASTNDKGESIQRIVLTRTTEDIVSEDEVKTTIANFKKFIDDTQSKLDNLESEKNRLKKDYEEKILEAKTKMGLMEDALVNISKADKHQVGAMGINSQSPALRVVAQSKPNDQETRKIEEDSEDKGDDDE